MFQTVVQVPFFCEVCGEEKILYDGACVGDAEVTNHGASPEAFSKKVSWLPDN